MDSVTYEAPENILRIWRDANPQNLVQSNKCGKMTSAMKNKQESTVLQAFKKKKNKTTGIEEWFAEHVTHI